MYSECLTAVHDKSSLKLTLSGGVSILMVDLKIYDLILKNTGPKIIFYAQKCKQILKHK